MGWKSTMNISRQAAMQAIMMYMMRAKTEDIMDALDCLVGDKIGYNFRECASEEFEDQYLLSLVSYLE